MTEALKLWAYRLGTKKLICDLEHRTGDVADVTFDALIGRQARFHPLIVEGSEFHALTIPQENLCMRVDMAKLGTPSV
jgi:hypothetical protein